jgi:hypothetical protein
MLTIEDLSENRELDREAMATIAGGTRGPLLDFASIFTPSNQTAMQQSAAQAFTGPQSNATFQSDNDVIMAAAGSQVINMGGNTSTSSNAASVASHALNTLLQNNPNS